MNEDFEVPRHIVIAKQGNSRKAFGFSDDLESEVVEELLASLSFEPLHWFFNVEPGSLELHQFEFEDMWQ